MKDRRKGRKVHGHPVELSVSCVFYNIKILSHFISSRFRSITPSNVMRNISTSSNKIISYRAQKSTLLEQQTAKLGEFIRIAEFFAYRSAQITLQPTVLFPSD